MNKIALSLMMIGLMAFMGCTRCTPEPVTPPVNPLTQTHLANAPDGCSSYPDTTVLPINLIGEQATQWCWAASGEMCMEFLNGGTKICQCDQANNLFPGNGCCVGNNPPACDLFLLGPSGSGDWPCNHVNWPDFKDYSFTAQSTVDIGVSGFTYGPLASGQNYLSFPDLQNQISCKRKPVIFMWQWNISGITDQAHLMVAYGYEVNDSLEGQWVLVNDPAKTYDIIPYSLYVTGSDHNHYLDFYNITGPASPSF